MIPNCFNNIEVFLSRHAYTALAVCLGSFSCWNTKLLGFRHFPDVISQRVKIIMYFVFIHNSISCELQTFTGWKATAKHVLQMAVDTHCCISLLSSFLHIDDGSHLDSSLQKTRFLLIFSRVLVWFVRSLLLNLSCFSSLRTTCWQPRIHWTHFWWECSFFNRVPVSSLC